MTFTDTQIIEGMAAADYFALDAVSRSDLAQVVKNPHRFKHWKATNHSTAAMQLGSLVHSLVLTPEQFVAEYLVSEEDSRRTKAWKADTEQAAIEGRECVLRSDVAEALAIEDAANSEFKSLFASARKEVVITGTHAATGMKVKARLDLLGDAFAADLKTTKDASSDGFARSIGAFRYDIQAAFYGDMAAAALGLDVCPFWFACVETEPPYLPALWDLTDAWVENGRSSYESALETYAIYQAKGWPTSYGRGTLSPKPWMIG